MTEFNLSAWALRNRPLMIFLIIVSLVAGVVSFQNLGRSEDPEFDIPVMTAVVAWPGATPDEIQHQIINRMEQAVQELPNLRYVTSFARQGYGGVTIAIGGRKTSEELNALWYQARKKIGDIRQQMPAGIYGPFFNDEYTDVYTALYAVAAPGLTAAERQEFAEQIKRKLQAVPAVNKANILGKQPERLFVEVSSRKLAALGLSPLVVIQSIAQQSPVRPAGQLETREDRVFIRMDGQLDSKEALESLSITVGDRLVRLGDIANIHHGVEDPPINTIRRNGEDVLTIGVTAEPGSNIIDLGNKLNETVQAIQKELPAGITLTQYADQPTIAKESVWEFEKSFLEALVIVLAVTFLFLGWRTGIVVAASVPLVLGIVAVVMLMFGWNLDRITLGALIIALGLLVDDAIIAVEMMVVKLEEGWDKIRAASYAYTSTAFPMLTGTLVTVAGFMPVGFAESTSGEYAGGIFWIVGIALLASWLVAVLFTPYLGVLLLPNVQKGHAHDPYDRPIYKRLRQWVDTALAYRKSVLVGTVGLFVAAILGMALVQQQFFPSASRVELLVELRLKAGSSITATQDAVGRSGSVKLNRSDKCIIGVLRHGKGAVAGDHYEQIIRAAYTPRI